MLDDKDTFSPAYSWVTLISNFVTEKRDLKMSYINGLTYFGYLRWIGKLLKDKQCGLDIELKGMGLIP